MAGIRDTEAVPAKTPRPTHADVARLAGVSTATVSYVLNKSEGRRISPATRDSVLEAAEQLGYRPNAAARNLATRVGEKAAAMRGWWASPSSISAGTT